MEVLADTALGQEDAAMKEDQVSIERIGPQQYLKVHRPCSVVHRAEMLIFCRVRMGNALHERTCWIRRRRV